MKYSQFLGSGIVIYALMRLVSDALIIHELTVGELPRVLSLAALVLLSLLAGASLRLDTWTAILPYSLFWVFEIAGLDAFYTVPFSGWAIFSDWNVWLGYSLVGIIPLFAPYISFGKYSHPTHS